MRVRPICALVFLLIFEAKGAQNVVGGAQKLKDALVNIGKNPALSKHSPFLSEFLDRHDRPSVHLDKNNMFNLNIDTRYQFKPPIRFAPFSSTGEPWPLPKHYASEKESVLRLDVSTFRISVLKKSCDILRQAISRYTKIIANQVIEEQYNFVHNFDEKTLQDFKKQEEAKYKNIHPMPNLDVYMESEKCEFPHADMKESYNLTVKPNNNSLVAEEIWGVLRGLETFSQLLFRKMGTDEVYAKVTEIRDEPRFPHRGILVDTARHYIRMDTLKNVLDGMAMNKMNVFHWHIVDDNSFPYQSEVFPKLSEKGAFHPSLVYTKSDIQEIVEYARYRGIRVVPEFDSPGHTFSWLGYPEVKSTCYVQNKALRGPLGPINPAQDETYTFMAKLFSEIYDVFPDSFVHLGGDELHSTCWATNPAITSYLQTFGNIPAFEARSNAQTYVNRAIGYYFKRLIKTLKDTASKKKQTKRFIMWEDVLKNTLEVPTDSILQVWLGSPSNILALNRQGYRALYSSCWYLDDYKRAVMWHDYYTCEPSPYGAEAEEKGRLLGGEACLWAEFITTDTLMTFMWPRASAPAERLWSPKSTRDVSNAQMRIQEQRCRMIYRGLPTGHISGPDYCLRPKEGSSMSGTAGEQRKLGGIDDSAYIVRDSTDGKDISLVVLSHYHHYLPAINILLSMTGVYLIIIASRCWKKKARSFSLCPRGV